MEWKARENLLKISTIVKYMFSISIICLTLHTTGNWGYVLIAMVEMFLILLLSGWMIQKVALPGRILNILLCLFFNAQILVLLFGNSYIQLVMLTNLNSLKDLGGKAFAYGIGAAMVCIASFLPASGFPSEDSKEHDPDKFSDKWEIIIWLFLLAFYIAILMAGGTEYSPACSYGKLISQYINVKNMNRTISEMDSAAEEFYSSEVQDNRIKDAGLGDRPNVILIFTEGLSQNIVDDSRMIMPNVKALEERSLNFTGYYNHTFATYRGLIGQLYSGYQLNDLDDNYLISLQRIFDYYQYHSAFINTEPENEEFSQFLAAMNFDELIGNAEDEKSGMVDSYSDREAYEMLFEKACEMDERNSPFFLCIYTFGTHVSLDSVDEKFGDGEDALLNKFYNDDVWLGEFLQKFDNSPLAENTILIFTADHCTYADSDFTAAFPDYTRECLMVDRIPFCIYYKGIVPETIDAGGRNSLDLAPTILDYLDMTAPNYFLGSSLFCENHDYSYDTVFNEEARLISTQNGVIEELGQEAYENIQLKLQRYFIARLQNDQVDTTEEVNEMFHSQVAVTLSEDNTQMEICYTPDTEYPQYWFAVWTSEDGQDDKLVYRGTNNEDGTWTVQIDMNNHPLPAELNIHVFGGTDAPEDLLDQTVFIL